jgi:5'-methylthioadenosine phosphorylase
MSEKIKIGVIGGSGLYEMEGIKNIEEITVDTPFGSPSDNIITGELEGVRVGFLPRHGRGHHIMPSGINFRANIYALKKLGAEKIVSLSAVGSMKENIIPGDVVVVDQFFDRTKNRPISFFGNGLVAHVGFDKPVCPVLSGQLYEAASKEEVKVHKGGTYICIEGPQFSTLGESLIYRQWGVDVIGMTAIPEVKLAREAEMCYATLALVTDFDCWYEGHDAVTVDVVVQQVMKNAETAKKIVASLIKDMARKDLPGCGCGEALKNAVMTAPDKIDPKMKEDLELLVGKYYK